MKITIKTLSTIFYITVGLLSIYQGDPWKTVGYFIIGMFIGLCLLGVWGKKVIFEDKE